MSLINIKKIARHRVTRTNIPQIEFEDHLKLWWSKKYNLPINDERLLSLTVEELLVEYFTDKFENNPNELARFEEEIQVKVTDEEEQWFKSLMGDDYTTENYFSDEFKKEQLKKDKQDGEFEDSYLEVLGK